MLLQHPPRCNLEVTKQGATRHFPPAPPITFLRASAANRAYDWGMVPTGAYWQCFITQRASGLLGIAAARTASRSCHPRSSLLASGFEVHCLQTCLDAYADTSTDSGRYCTPKSNQGIRPTSGKVRLHTSTSKRETGQEVLHGIKNAAKY